MRRVETYGLYKKFITEEVKKVVNEVLESGYYTRGMQNKEFEKEFAQFCGAKFAVAVSSGTAALHLAMIAAGVGPGDEIITCPNSFTATADCILYVGAKPIFVEPNEETFTIDPEKIEEKITPKTRAIIVIHLYGHPAHMDEIMEIAAKHELMVIEDAAHASGAMYKGKKIGSIGDNNIACFSFMNKCMTVCGDGGMVVTNNEELAHRVKLHRYLGQDDIFTWEERNYIEHVLGYNYRMSEIAAAIGRIMLKKLPYFNEKRRENAKLYTEALQGFPEIKTPVEKNWAYHTYLHYVVRVGKKRNALRQFLKQKGIECGVSYEIPIHLQPVYRNLFGFKEGDFPITEKEKKECLTLPTHPALNPEDIEYVIEAIKDFYR